MSEGTRRPGPWDEPAAPARPREDPVARREAGSGRHLLWSVISTALFGGFLWYLLGPLAAVAIIFGLLVHEYGHVLAINASGCGPGRIHVIPFLGGAAEAKRASPTEWIDVKIALAGPAFGILAALPFFGLWWWTKDTSWLQGATLIGLLNFLNLAPAPPLDGSKAIGPVLARIHPMVERAALLAVGGLAVWWGITTGRYILGLFLALGVLGALRSGALRPNAVKLTGGEQLRSVALYLLTAGVCFAVLFAAVRLGGTQNLPLGLSELIG